MEAWESGDQPDTTPPAYTVTERYVDPGTGEQVTKVMFEGDPDEVEFRIAPEEHEVIVDGYMLWKENNQNE
jgi:hypothetical protein